MYKYLLLALVFLTAFSQQEVPHLTSVSIQTAIQQNPIILLKLYVPWCKYCKSIVPEIKLLHQMSNQKNYKVFQIDCDVEKQLCKEYQVKSFPTLRLLTKGSNINYGGDDRTATAIDSWIQRLLSMQLPQINQKDIEEKQGKQTFLLVGGLNQTQRLQILAVKLSRQIGIEFYEIESKQKVLSLYFADKKDKKDFTFPTDPTQFAGELFHNARDTIMSVDNPKYLQFFINQLQADQVIVFYNHNDKLAQSAPVLIQYCHEFLTEVMCFTVQKNSPHYQQFAKYFKPHADRSTIVYSRHQKNKGYNYPNEVIEASSLRSFVEEVRDNRRVAEYDRQRDESQKIIKYNNVISLQQATHNKTIQQNDLVFIQYYSTTCQHCVKFAQDYDKIAKTIKEAGRKVVVAAIDISLNREIGLEQDIQMYPTLKMFVKGSPVEYDGYRIIQSIVDYITQVSMVRLLVAPHVKDVRTPAITISGLSSDSPLHTLPAFFDRYPVYWITKESQFKIQIHDKSIKTYEGDIELAKVANWLQAETAPVLSSLGDSKVSKKLLKAMKQKIPILALINKGEQGPTDTALQLLTEYCQNVTDFVCGYANKGEEDYEDLITWIADPNPTANRIIWMDIQTLTCFLHQGTVKDLTADKITEFIGGVKNGTIKTHQKPPIEDTDSKETEGEKTESQNEQTNEEL